MYAYTCIYVKRPDNVWGDLVRCWSAPKSVRRIVQIIQELPSAPRKTSSALRRTTSNCNQCSLSPTGAIWIPTEASDLQLQLCLISHTGLDGHSGTETTDPMLSDVFFWPAISTEMEAFVLICLHCHSRIGEKKERRPLGTAVH